LVTWSTKQQTILLSSIKEKYISLIKGAKLTTWLKGLMVELRFGEKQKFCYDN
jgi:hypothetical protein